MLSTMPFAGSSQELLADVEFTDTGLNIDDVISNLPTTSSWSATTSTNATTPSSLELTMAAAAVSRSAMSVTSPLGQGAPVTWTNTGGIASAATSSTGPASANITSSAGGLTASGAGPHGNMAATAGVLQQQQQQQQQQGRRLPVPISLPQQRGMLVNKSPSPGFAGGGGMTVRSPVQRSPVFMQTTSPGPIPAPPMASPQHSQRSPGGSLMGGLLSPHGPNLMSPHGQGMMSPPPPGRWSFHGSFQPEVSH